MPEPSPRRVKEIFNEAVGLPPDERPAFLDAACGADDALRRRVERLLRALDEAGPFLASPTQTSHGGPSAAETEPLRPGRTLGTRYRIVALAGRGGMGEVYRAEDLTLGQTVALKLLPETVGRDAGRLARLREEVRVARQVSHPNVCRVYDIGEADGRHFLSMEWIEGEDLASILRASGRLPADRALWIAGQISAGLAAAHESGVVHRDLKPANVMVDDRGIARITDFGLAEVAEAIRGERAREGTPKYMSPEQLEGSEVGFPSDLYSLGLVLYELFTGKPGVAADSLEDRMRRKREPPTPPSSLAPDIDRRVEKLILRCLEFEPGRRPPSARAILEALPGGETYAGAVAAAQRRADRIAAFRDELAELRRAGLLALREEDLERVERHHERTLADLVQRFDVDVSDRGKQLSLGMRVVSLVGAIAFAASGYWFFYRIWGTLSTPAQVAILAAAPMLALVLTAVLARRERSRHFTAMAGISAVAFLVVDVSILGSTFNLTPSPFPLLAWGLFALLLAYAYRLRLLLVAGALALASFQAGILHGWSGGFWPEYFARPETWFPAGLALTALARWRPAALHHGFATVYRVLGVALLVAPAVFLGMAGALSYLPLEPRSIEIGYQVYGFAAGAAAIAWGIARRRPDVVYTGTFFFVLLLFLQFVNWWWAWMPKYLFFLIVALTSLLVALALKRLRAALVVRPAEVER